VCQLVREVGVVEGEYEVGSCGLLVGKLEGEFVVVGVFVDFVAARTVESVEQFLSAFIANSFYYSEILPATTED